MPNDPHNVSELEGFSYCLEIIPGREFSIHVDTDGMIHFYDRASDEATRPKGYSERQLAMMFGEIADTDEFENRERDYTVSIPIPIEHRFDLEFATALFHSEKWTPDHEADLDTKLVPLFWEHINHRLKHPIPRP